jgi:hypothetical protein
MKYNNVQYKRNAFLAAYREIGNISRACILANVHRNSHYLWMNDESYRKEFEDAQEEACDHLEEEARHRAVEGFEEPIYYKGKQCGTIRKYSDTLLIFLMKGARPAKYRDHVKPEFSHLDGLAERLERASKRLPDTV